MAIIANQPHHQDRQFVVDGKRIRDIANANPDARCWRCRRTLAEHPPTKTGKPPTWTAGHTIDGVKSPPWLNVMVAPPEGQAWLAAEANVCNASAGARAGNAKPNLDEYDW